MGRVKLVLPDEFIFTTEISLRVSDINYGGHLGNDAVLSLCHEMRARLFAEYGFTELDVDGVGILMIDAVIVFRSEAFYGETLVGDVAVCNFSRTGCDLFYLLRAKSDGREVARAKTGIVFLDYSNRRIRPVPQKFREIFEG